MSFRLSLLAGAIAFSLPPFVSAAESPEIHYAPTGHERPRRACTEALGYLSQAIEIARLTGVQEQQRDFGQAVARSIFGSGGRL